jgi:hypothetical protein
MRTTSRFGAGIAAGLLLLGSATQWVPGAAAASAGPRLVLAAGQVSNLSPTGFTLTRTRQHPRANGSTTVVVQVSTTPATREIARKGTTGALANGEYALVGGLRTDSTLSARRVLYAATPFRVHRHRAIGTVSASSATFLTIQTRNGKSVTFEINGQTHYRVNKQLQSAAPQFTKGERVAVRFRLDRATKARLARVITILPPA